MALRTITRADLSEAVYEEVGLTRQETALLVEDVLETVIQAMEQGEHVKLSSFASFNLRQKNERIGRNPKTGVEVMIQPRRVVSFKASQTLKERVARGGK